MVDSPVNQWLPNPPLEDIAPFIRMYWDMRKNDKEILELLLAEHIDTSRFGLGIKKLRSMRAEMGLDRARTQGHSAESIAEVMATVRKEYPTAGWRDCSNILFQQYDMAVSRHTLEAYFQQYEPEQVKQRKQGRLKRRRFWAAGVNETLSLDQHDKWRHHGLCLHVAIDAFSGYILWLKVWWTNRNPILICSYFLDFVEKGGYVPLVTQSDPGTENYGVANAQTYLRQAHDPSLEGTLQHRWMRIKKNIHPEIAWSQFRRRFAPGFEKTLDEGVNGNLYDVDREFDKLLFRFLFIPWMQAEVDSYVDRVNRFKKRKDSKKILPNAACPQEIYFWPHRFDNARDFKVMVDKARIDEARALYADPNHPVFELVPPDFRVMAENIYEVVGHPQLTHGNIWQVYSAMYAGFQQMEALPAHVESWIEERDRFDCEHEQPYQLCVVNNRGSTSDIGAAWFGKALSDEEEVEMAGSDEERPLEIDFSDDEELHPMVQGTW